MFPPRADLDSLCSALLCAYLRTYTPPHTLHIPLCNIPRDDLTLRPEFTEVLRRADVTPNDVITLDELPAADELARSPWFLVDHNSLTGRLAQYRDRVVGCIDHHDDEGHLPQDCQVRVIEKTGSCMSLIVNHCWGAWEELRKSADPPAPGVDEQLAYLALAPILIDTHNFTDRNKTTRFDESAARRLEETLVGPAYVRDRFFAEVSELKEDISSLSMRDVLRKDYKEWVENGLRLGTSSAPVDFAGLTDKVGGTADALAAELRRWADEKDIDLLCVLTSCTRHDAFCRELLVFARTEKGAEAARGFEQTYSDKLGLSPWSDGQLHADSTNQWLRCWDQAQVKNSRKQIAPMLRESMKTLGSN